MLCAISREDNFSQKNHVRTVDCKLLKRHLKFNADFCTPNDLFESDSSEINTKLYDFRVKKQKKGIFSSVEMIQFVKDGTVDRRDELSRPKKEFSAYTIFITF